MKSISISVFLYFFKRNYLLVRIWVEVTRTLDFTAQLLIDHESNIQKCLNNLGV